MLPLALLCFIAGPPMPEPLPPGAIARMGSPAFRMATPANVVRYSPDGKTIATGHEHGVRLWDRETGSLVGLLPKASTRWKLAFTPDGKRLLTSNGQVWHVGTGRLLAQIGRGSDHPQLVVSADGKWAFTGHDSGVVAYEINSGLPGRVFWGHKKKIRAVATSPVDASEIASVDSEGKLLVWDTSTKEIRWQGKLPKAASVQCLAYDPTGKMVAVADIDGEVSLWSKTGRLRSLGKVPTYVRALDISKKGTLAVGSDDGFIRLFDCESGKEIGRCESRPIAPFSIAFHPNGEELTSVGHEGHTVYRWDAKTGKRLRTEWGHEGPIVALVAQPEGRLRSLGQDRRVIHWNDSRSIRQTSLEGVISVNPPRWAFSADGNRAAVLEFVPREEIEYHISIYDSESRKRSQNVSMGTGFPNYTYGISFHPRLPHLLIALSQSIATLRPEDKAAVRRRVTPGERREQIHWFPDGKQVLISEQMGVRIVDLSSEKLKTELRVGFTKTNEFDFTLRPQLAVIAPDGNWVALCEAFPRQVRLWNPSRSFLTQAVTLKTDPIGVFVSPDGRWLAILGILDPERVTQSRTELRVVEVCSQATVFQAIIPTFHHQACFAPDRPEFYTGGISGQIFRWRLSGAKPSANAEADWQRLREPAGHDAAWRLALTPGVEALLARKLRPTPSLDARLWATLLDDLDSEDFAARQAAQKRLDALGTTAIAAARRTLAGDTRLEIRRRLERFLRGQPLTPEGLRQHRAVFVLEQRKATALLYRLAEGDPDADLTREARSALARLNKGK